MTHHTPGELLWVTTRADLETQGKIFSWCVSPCACYGLRPYMQPTTRVQLMCGCGFVCSCSKKGVGYIAVCHLGIAKAFSLAGAWSYLERIIFNAVSVLLSLLMRMINDHLLCILVYKIVIKLRESSCSQCLLCLFFHAFYSMHFFLTVGWIYEKMHAVKGVKCTLVKMKE